MSTRARGNGVLVAAVAAVLLEGALIWIGYRTPASHSPSLIFVFHLPGMLLAQPMHLSEAAELVFLGCTGAVQLFVLFWIGLLAWRRAYAR
jgi:hypothetical protein